jgi:hypothetical protein
VLNVPIFVDGTHWGVLEVDTVEKRNFEEFEIHSLSIFANILGVSLAKDAARNAAAKAASLINESKSETEIMLRELQHRMKNNLQVIVSFLALQGRESMSDGSFRVLAGLKLPPLANATKYLPFPVRYRTYLDLNRLASSWEVSSCFLLPRSLPACAALRPSTPPGTFAERPFKPPRLRPRAARYTELAPGRFACGGDAGRALLPLGRLL